MIRYLLPLVLLCSGCLATSAATEELKASIDALAAAQADPATTQAELDALAAAVAEKVAAVKEAPAQDVAAGKEWFLGLSEEQAGGTGLIGIGLTALSWWLRDRRKRQGKDPIQVQAKAGPQV